MLCTTRGGTSGLGSMKFGTTKRCPRYRFGTSRSCHGDTASTALLDPKWLQKNAPLAFWTQSTFTLVGRWEQVDLDGNKLRRWTVGLNYRPIESTVFKFDYQFNQGKGSAPDDTDNDALVISIASYF